MNKKEKTIKYLENIKKRAENCCNFWDGKTRKDILREVAFAKKYQAFLIPIIKELDELTGGKHYCCYKDCKKEPRTFIDGRFVYCDKHLRLMAKRLKNKL